MNLNRGPAAMGLLAALVLSGCSLFDISQQAETLEATGIIEGGFTASGVPGPVIAALFQQSGTVFVLVDRAALPDNLRYTFEALPGTYFLGAFVDSNGDGQYDENEPATYLGIDEIEPSAIEVAANQTVRLDTLAISGPIQGSRRSTDWSSEVSAVTRNIGRVVSLDDEMFSRDSASLGFWRPLDYLDEYGGGLMLLQDFSPEKTPVVFVHGIFGTARDFEDLIFAIDTSRYQPWILQYPSGLRLDTVSSYLLYSMEELHDRYGFDHAIVIAHSMGGLVTRSYVMQQSASASAYSLAMVMTINSPMYGLDSAASGVRFSPIVIPAWRDVATGSDFVTRIHDWQWPTEIPYELVFSYLPDEPGDGVVPLSSQLSASLQEEAIDIYGFEGQHAEMLHDARFIEHFIETLNSYP